jgi:hypothetical protein
MGTQAGGCDLSHAKGAGSGYSRAWGSVPFMSMGLAVTLLPRGIGAPVYSSQQGDHSIMTHARSATAIIGAGPFGFSIAAHLRNSGIQFRIFGKSMERSAKHRILVSQRSTRLCGHLASETRVSRSALPQLGQARSVVVPLTDSKAAGRGRCRVFHR